MSKACLSLLLVFFLVVPALGHVPLFEDDHGGILIDDTQKTTVFYTHLKKMGDSQEYIFEMLKGERLAISIIAPDSGSAIRASLTMPDNTEINLQMRETSRAVYEPFAPTYYYELLKHDEEAGQSGEYRLKITTLKGDGKVAVTSGYLEKFTFIEWIIVPFRSLQIYQWSGQSWLSVLAPLLLIVISGLLYLNKKSITGILSYNGLIQLSGLFYFGGAAIMLTQMLIATLKAGLSSQILLTLLFILGGTALALFTFHLSGIKKDYRGRVRLLIVGIFGLIMWAGLLIGPALAIFSSILPEGGKDLKHTK